MSTVAPSLPDPESIGGRYRLVGRLGAGASRTTFKALDGEKRVTVKVFRDVADPAERQRLSIALDAWSSLRVEHVVPVLDQGVDSASGAPFVVLPWVDGPSLGALLGAQAPIVPGAVVRLARQLASGLEAAHQHGVLHLNVKPSNVLLDRLDDGRMMALLSDVGVSPRSLGAVSAAGEYAAPEQHSGSDDLDERADLWSLGALLFHALSGHPPSPAAQEQEPAAGSDADVLARVAPWVTEPLTRIVGRLLRRDRSARFADTAELMTALSAIDDGGDDLFEDEIRTIELELRSTAVSPVADAGSPAPSDSDPTGLASSDVGVGTVLDGRYELVRRLGEGGMGAVYEATTAGGERVAIKVIRPDGGQPGREARARFVREARTAMAIDSDNVVSVLEAGTDPGSNLPFLVMELMTGADLAHVIQRHGALEPDIAVAIILDACRGLAAAHRKGMIHRDIKPGNIFLHDLPGGSVRAKVCDFGVVKRDASFKDHASTGLTQSGGLLGSPLYMSPEQAENARLADPRSDIWSMCASLYEALTGAPPWTGCSTVGEVLLRLYTRDVPAVQDAAPWIEPGLARALHRGLQRNPLRRYASAEELASSIAPFARDIPVRRADVRGVASERRAARAPRVTALAGDVAASSAGRPARAVPRRWTPTIAAVSVLAATGVALVLLRTGGDSPPARPAVAESPAVSAPIASPSLVPARVRIEPPSASVAVNGRPAPVKDGWIDVEAAPGARVMVTLDDRGIHAKESVVVTAAGEAIPSVVRLAVPGAAASNSGVSAASVSHKPVASQPGVPSASPTVSSPGLSPSGDGPRLLREW
jgi:serine/threonine-protein kinase